MLINHTIHTFTDLTAKCVYTYSRVVCTGLGQGVGEVEEGLTPPPMLRRKSKTSTFLLSREVLILETAKLPIIWFVIIIIYYKYYYFENFDRRGILSKM